MQSPRLRRFSSTLDGQPPRHSAKHPFETTDGTVTGIVAEVGPRDPGTSSAVLTRLTGQRPREYRRARTKRRTNLLTNRPATSGHRQKDVELTGYVSGWLAGVASNTCRGHWLPPPACRLAWCTEVITNTAEALNEPQHADLGTSRPGARAADRDAVGGLKPM